MTGIVVAQECDYRVSRTGELFVIGVRGFWDRGSVVEFQRRLQLLVELSGMTHWGLVVDFREWEGASEEAMSLLEALFEWMADYGEIAAAFVVNSGVTSAALQMVRTSQEARVAFETFISLEIAIPWVAGTLRRGRGVE